MHTHPQCPYDTICNARHGAGGAYGHMGPSRKPSSWRAPTIKSFAATLLLSMLLLLVLLLVHYYYDYYDDHYY